MGNKYDLQLDIRFFFYEYYNLKVHDHEKSDCCIYLPKNIRQDMCLSFVYVKNSHMLYL